MQTRSRRLAHLTFSRQVRFMDRFAGYPGGETDKNNKNRGPQKVVSDGLRYMSEFLAPPAPIFLAFVHFLYACDMLGSPLMHFFSVACLIHEANMDTPEHSSF